MEENEQTSQQNERIGNGNEKKIYAFLDRLSYDESQRALFFLGRMLSSVAFIQEGKKRNILDKVNFNGMKLPDILRLRNNLIEKAKQYNAVSKVIFNDAEFTKYFRYEGWKMSPQEAVFFILSGYSFGINLAKETNKQNSIN
jgi:CRISPR-associated protein Csh1